jgi:HTH-type transcriptional regulator/antitoxin HigA
MTQASYGSIPKTYQDLVRLHPPRPIRDDVALASAIEVVDQMAGFDLNEDQADYLEAVSTFVERYEETRFPLEMVHESPLSALRFLMGEHGMNPSDLGELLGERSIGAPILSGERDLTLANIRRLSEHFCVEPSVLID